MNLRILIIGLGLTSLFGPLSFPISASAQTTSEVECPYLDCSLRLKSGLFGRSLVRGAEEEKVIGLGDWIGSLDPVFEGHPKALALAERFRHRNNVGSVVSLLGLVAVVTGYVQGEGSFFSPEGDLSVGLVVGGSLLGFGGGLIRKSGEDALQRAIWEYNNAIRH